MANAPFSLYPFSPSTAAAILFTVLYGLLATHHTYMHTIYPRRQRPNPSTSRPSKCRHNYTIPTAIAAWLSTTGYALRIASIQQSNNISLYASSSGMIVIAPIFVCATLYLLLARLIRRCLPPSPAVTPKANNSRANQPPSPSQTFLKIPAPWIGRLFLTSDVLSFLTQASGSSLAASANWAGSEARIGTHILLLGLALQLATFSAFIVLLWRFVCRVRALAQREGSGNESRSGFEPKVKQVLVGVGLASVAIEIRSVYRVVEFALGIDGYPFRSEWMLYVLEAVPMGVAVAAVGWAHPLRLLGQEVETETEREKGEVEAGLERGT